MVVFSAILSLPVDSRASVSYKTEVSYNSTENKREGQTTAKTVQERFAAIMNVNSSLSSKLRMTGLLRFDLVMRENVNGSESTELQPNINLKFSTNAVQLNTGYRQITRDESIITGNTTTEQTTETTDAVLDAVIRAGALPDTRLRYNSRDNLRVESGATVEDTNTTEVRAAFNYKLGIFALNADYSNQTDKNNVDSSEQTRTQASGQLLANKRFSDKVSVILRESYFLAKTTDTNADDTKRNNSISEARLIFSPIERSLINTNFLYSVQDSENGSSKTDTTETNFFTTASYVLPKYLRFYGSFTTRETDTDTTDKLLLTTDNSVVNVDTTVWGVNFKHSVGKFNIVARYESRTDKTDTDDTAAAVVSTSVEATRNNFDWLVDAQLTRYLSLALSEAYVLTERTDSTGGSSSNE